MEGFGQMAGLDRFAAGQVGDGAGHPQDFIVASGGESQALVCRTEQVLSLPWLRSLF